MQTATQTTYLPTRASAFGQQLSQQLFRDIGQFVAQEVAPEIKKRLPAGYDIRRIHNNITSFHEPSDLLPQQTFIYVELSYDGNPVPYGHTLDAQDSVKPLLQELYGKLPFLLIDVGGELSSAHKTD